MRAGGIKIKWIKTKIIKTRAIMAVLLLATLFSGCSSSSKSNSNGASQNPAQSRGEAREELGAESGAGQEPTSSPISRGVINNEYSPGSGRLIVKLEILDNLISYESVSFARVHITPQDLMGKEGEYLALPEDSAPQDEIPLDIDASLSIDVALSVGDESARLDFGYVAFGRYILNATIYHNNGNALAYSELLIDVGLADDIQTGDAQTDDTQIDDTQIGEAEVQIEYIRPSPDATDPALAEYTATLIFDLSSALFRLVTLPLVFTDDDNDGLLDIWHPAYLAAIADDLDGSLDGSYELTADLDLYSYGNWQPLGSEEQPFRGTFVGNGHSISGLSVKGHSRAGLFAALDGASIKDLMVEVRQINASNYNDASYSAGFAGAVAGLATHSTFANITVEMNSYDDESPYITAFAQDGVTYVGGLVGRLRYSSIANTTIMANGIISAMSLGDDYRARSYVGGLAGLVNLFNEITNVEVVGEVDLLASSFDGVSMGGLIGSLTRSEVSAARVALSGDIISYSDNNYLLSGGAVGECSSSPIVDMNIFVEGNILAESSGGGGDVYVGGAIGEADRCNIINLKTDTYGTISATGSYADRTYFSTGGLAGFSQRTETNDVTVTHNGDLLSLGDSCYVGAVVGYSYYETMNNVSATINGNLIAGAPNSEVGISFNCHVGAILGYSENLIVSNSYAIVNGDVLSYANDNPAAAGGFVGKNEKDIEIDNSYALIKGNLAATSFFAPTYIGGLVGDSDGELLIVRDSYVQILGNITLRSILSEDENVSSGGNFVGITKGADFTNSYVFIGGKVSAINIPVLGTSSPAVFGGAWGETKMTNNDPYSITLSSSYYRSRRESSEGGFNSAKVDGDAIDVARSDLQLRCPQAAGQNCGGAVTPGNPQTYVGWDESVWDFGATDELPRLRVFPSTNLLD